MSNFPSLHPAGFLPCVRPVERHAAPAATAVSAGLEHVENTPRRSAMLSCIKHAFAAIGGHVRQAFVRIFNPGKGRAEPPAKSPIELLRQYGWTCTARTIDAVSALVRDEHPVEPGQWQPGIDALADCLALFRAPGAEGMGLPPDGRQAFHALVEGPAVGGYSIRELSQRLALGQNVLDTPPRRTQFAGFVNRVKLALVEHATDVDYDLKLELLRRTHTPRDGAWVGTPV